MPDNHYAGPDRREDAVHLTEDQVEMIAERAAEKAMAKLTASLYQEIGKSVVSRVLTLAGILTVAFALWASSKGIIKL